SALKKRSSSSCTSRTFEPLTEAKTRIPPRPCWRTSQGTDSAAVAPSSTRRPYPASPFCTSSRVTFSWRGELNRPVPTHVPVHFPAMFAPFDVGVYGSGSGVFAAAALAAGALAAGAGVGTGAGVAAGGGVVVAEVAGVVPAAVGSVASDVDVPLAASAGTPLSGVPVVSAVPAPVSVAGGASTRVADGSDLLQTEHEARSGISASTSSARIEPPLTLPAFTCANGTSRARRETSHAGST